MFNSIKIKHFLKCETPVKHVLLLFSRVQLFVTLWTVARQAPLSMGSPRQEHWSTLPFPSQGIFLTQGLNAGLLHWQVGSSTGEAPIPPPGF